MKVETHNHPTAIAPWWVRPPGRAEKFAMKRDRHRRQTEGRPHWIFCFQPENPWCATREWERDYGKPSRIASALDIMIEGPLGVRRSTTSLVASILCGYFRTLEQDCDGVVRGYHRPIMIAGGYGNISAQHTKTRCRRALLIQLGGPGMRIGFRWRCGLVDDLRYQHRGWISIPCSVPTRKWSAAARK